MLAITETSIVTIAVAAIAATSSIISAVRAGRVDNKVDTGHDTDIGTTVRATAAAVEVLTAQVHTNTTETLAVSAKLDQHLADVEAIDAWTRRQMEEE